jgi:hypothetical protein
MHTIQVPGEESWIFGVGVLRLLPPSCPPLRRGGLSTQDAATAALRATTNVLTLTLSIGRDLTVV